MWVGVRGCGGRRKKKQHEDNSNKGAFGHCTGEVLESTFAKDEENPVGTTLSEPRAQADRSGLASNIR